MFLTCSSGLLESRDEVLSLEAARVGQGLFCVNLLVPVYFLSSLLTGQSSAIARADARVR